MITAVRRRALARGAATREAAGMPVAALRANPVLLRALLSSLVARLPLVMMGLGMVLLVRHLHHPYWAVGLVSGVFILASGLMAPMLGRLSDRLGAARVLLVSTVVACSALGVLAAVPDRLGIAGLAVVGAVAGAGEPPVNAVVRALMPRLAEDDLLSRIYTLEAALQEVLFIVGPPAVTLIATLASPRAGVAVCAVLLAVSVTWFTAEIRGHAAPPRDTRGPSALRSADLRLLVVAFGLIGVTFGAIDISVVASLEQHGHRNLAGLALGAWAVGSLVGGVVAARTQSGDPWRRLPWLFAAMCALTLPLALLQRDVWLLGLGLMAQGGVIAPTLGAVWEVVPRITSPDALTEAFAWTSSFILAGVAAGAAATGVLVGWTGPPGGFTLAAVTPAAAAAVAIRLAGRLDVPEATS